MTRMKIFLMVGILTAVSQVFAGFNITDTYAINGGGTETDAFTADISDPNVTLSNTTAPSLGGAAAIAAYGVTPGDGNFVSTVTVANNGGNSLCGLLGNFDIATLSGYYLEFDYFNSKAYLARIDGGDSTNLDETTLTYSATESYILELRYDGELTGRLYDSSHQLLETLTSSDSDYSSGVTGVMAYSTVGFGGDNSTTGAFTNYDIVPEPVTCVLAAAGLCGLIARKHRN